ncbi:MAG: sel1 repeat family protein [Coxiellaceae bacterium]|nr:MAG: sel1 repeat family protein [Coxiellaceae bacterium]
MSLYHLFVVAAYQAEIILCPLTNNLSFSQALRPAFQYYFRKATTGDVDAQFRLGVGYYYGLGIETDLNKALYWLSQAAKQNYTAAEVFLGVLNDQALLPNHTEQAALQWFFRAAKQNDPIGKTMLGIYYLYGRGNLVADPNIANYWLQQSVKLNYGLAQVYLAELYYSGKGVEQNYPHALQLFKKA